MIANIYFPDTIDNIYMQDGGIPIIDENSDLLIELKLNNPRKNMSSKSEFFKSLKNAKNLSKLQILRLQNLKVSSLSDYLESELPSITSLDLSGYQSDNTDSLLEDLDGIEKFTGLNTLAVNYTSANLDISAIKNCLSLTNVQLAHCNINSLNGIENLTNLNYLILKDNNITNLKPLENLKNLTSLNLENNAIADTSSYVDTDRSTKTYKNLDILAGLHTSRSGKLSSLYLAGNDNIIDYSPVSSLSWSAKSGF